MKVFRKVSFVLCILFSLLLFTVTGFAAEIPVPVGYSILEYIQSTGTQYIDTGVMPNSNNFGISGTIEYVGSPSARCAFGSQSGNGFSIVFYGPQEIIVGTSGSITRDYTRPVNTPFDFSLTAASGTLSGSQNGESVSFNYSGNILNSVSFAIFTNNGGDASQRVAMKLYDFRINNNGTLVRDYVPVKNLSNEVGLWDKVTGQFVGNSGTGSFTAGNVIEVVTPVEYTVTVADSYANVTGAGSYVEGATVTINAGTRDGYDFTGWTSSVSLADSTVATTTFVMPAENVTVSANWAPSGPPPPTYAVTVNDSYAAVTGAGSYAEGVTVTINAGTRDGFNFAGWQSDVTLSDASSATTTFVMPAQSVTVSATWEDIPDPTDFDGWTPIETHYLFSGGDSWTMDMTSSNMADGGLNATLYGSSGSFGGTFGTYENNGIFWQDKGVIQLRFAFGGMLLESGQTYRLRYVYDLQYSSLTTTFNQSFDFGDVTVIASQESVTGGKYVGDIVFRSNSDHFMFFTCNATGAYYLNGNISGRLDRVEATASGDSFSNTATDIANKNQQIHQIEDQIFTDLDLYNSQLDISGATNLPFGMLNAVSFIGSTWTDAFNQLGDFKSVVTFPLFLGLALLFIGRGSSVIVSGAMRIGKNNEYKGGGDIGGNN